MDAPREKSLLQGTWGPLIPGGSGGFYQPTDSPRAFLHLPIASNMVISGAFGFPKSKVSKMLWETAQIKPWPSAPAV